MTGYRTLIFNGIALIVALVQHFGGPLPAVDPELFGFAVIAANFALRFITKTPVGGSVGASAPEVK